MKKALSILLLSFVLFSCKGEAGEKQNTDAAAAANTEEAAGTKTVIAANEPTGKAIHLTKEEFLAKVMNYEKNTQEWVYEGDKPCIVDFYADWCGPCKIASPVLDELAAEYAGEIYVYKVNTETERELAGVFGIRSIPSFLLVPQEGRPSMSSGIGRTPEETKEMFKKMIEEVLLAEKDA